MVLFVREKQLQKGRPIMIRIVAALILGLFVVSAHGEEQTARQFLQSIYGSYTGENEGGPPLDNASLGRYFTPELAALIKADSDQAAARGEVPMMNGDPFIDAQEWKISGLKIVVEEPKPGFATGIVTFRNYERADEIRLDLLRLAEGWRIADIHAPSGGLRALYGR
jgi:hypothetical protein